MDLGCISQVRISTAAPVDDVTPRTKRKSDAAVLLQVHSSATCPRVAIGRQLGSPMGSCPRPTLHHAALITSARIPDAPPALLVATSSQLCLSATRAQAIARGRKERMASDKRYYGRPALPPSMDGAALEGWLVKRGSGYPHKWQRRYFVFLAATSTLHYFAADGSEGAAYQSKGEVVISLIKPHPSEPLGLSFEVASSSRAGGKLVNSSGKVRLSLGGSFSGNVSANKTRSLLARAPNAQEHARWLAVSTEASSPHLAKTASFSGHL